MSDRSNTSGGNTGNIKTLDGEDFTFPSNKTIVLFMFSSIDNLWHQISNPSGGVSLSDNNVWTGTNSFQGSSFTVQSATINLGNDVTDITQVVGTLKLSNTPQFLSGSAANQSWGLRQVGISGSVMALLIGKYHILHRFISNKV